MERWNIRNHLKWFTIPSFLIHVIWLRPALKPPSVVQSPDVTSPIELAVVENQRADNPTFNRTKARFGAEFSQRVAQETRASRSGRFSQQPSLPLEALALGDLLPPAATPNRLPSDIKAGNETLLNSDAVSFASFMRRVTDEIYQDWVDNASRAVTEIVLEGQHLSANVYITKLAISMDGAGRVVAIETLRSSGIPELDQAPQRAFWDRSTFPNPPQQMVKADGSIQFVYEFYFEYKTSSFRAIPWAI